jgi:hypothetical protein
MKPDAAGVVIHQGEAIVSGARIRGVAQALASASGAETATLVPWFGPTVAGEQQFVTALGLDLTKALLGGLSYQWERPFQVEETVGVKVFVQSVTDKGTNRFGVVVSEFNDKSGRLIHRQSATFIETMGT